MARLLRIAGLASLLVGPARGIEIDVNDADSVRDGASTVAYGLLKYYTGNETGDVPGNLPDPYFWWEAGAMFGTLVDYWHITGDETYNDITLQAMVHQGAADEGANFMPSNQTASLGNDDQGFWAMSAMMAAENNFPNPDEDEVQWLPLVQAVFNNYVERWEPATCDGGLRWQILATNAGYDYKNSISNGCFFNIASRLARYTGNDTYAEWAAEVYQWQVDVGYIKDDFRIEDGAHIDNDCTENTEILWSYNHGIFMHGAAVMYNITEDDEWKTRLDGLVAKSTELFFNNSIAFEQNCEPFLNCNIDQRSFKGYLLRWMAATSQLAPHTAETILPLLSATGQAAALACDGSPDATEFNGIAGTACGQDWSLGTYDGFAGVGEQMNALSAIIYTQIQTADIPLTADTGGTSESDPDAGVTEAAETLSVIETKDRVAAGFLTAAICLGLMSGSWYAIKDDEGYGL